MEPCVTHIFVITLLFVSCHFILHYLVLQIFPCKILVPLIQIFILKIKTSTVKLKKRL